MKECNKCDTAPQFLFPSAFSRAAASVTTALQKRHMLHFSPLPLHSVTLRVTLPEPCESLSNTGLALSCYTVTRKTQVPLPQSFLCPDRSPPRERFFAAALPCKKRLRVRTRSWDVQAVFRGACGKTARSASTRGGYARGWGNGIPLFREGQHRICLYVGPWPPPRQMPPRAVPTPVMGRCPKPRSYGKTK